MMAENADTITVRIQAKDEFTPVLRRLGWSLVLFKWRDRLTFGVWTIWVFLMGMLAAHLPR